MQPTRVSRQRVYVHAYPSAPAASCLHMDESGSRRKQGIYFRLPATKGQLMIFQNAST
jgi:hypothetical protein